jgi:hypothetical protein
LVLTNIESRERRCSLKHYVKPVSSAAQAKAEGGILPPPVYLPVLEDFAP